MIPSHSEVFKWKCIHVQCCRFMNGSWMVHEWCTNGSWMVHEWFMNGSWMVHEWCTNGSWMVHEWCTNVYLHLSSACTHAFLPACLCTPLTYNESLVLWSTQLLQIEVQHHRQSLHHTLQGKAKTQKDSNTQRRSDSPRYITLLRLLHCLIRVH